MSQELKADEYDDVAKRVSKALYQDLQRTPDEPLSITVLANHLKHRMGWSDEEITKLRQEIDLTSSTIDYQDIVQYLSTHNVIAQEMQQYFLNHSISNMPKISSYGTLRGTHTVSSYFMQPNTPTDLRIQASNTPMFMQPQLYLYDQTQGIPLMGTTDRQGGGTLYQNPLYHGHPFASSPRVKLNRKNSTVNELEVEYDVKTESSSDSSSKVETQTTSKVDMESWVRFHSGNRVIRKLLVANNGIAAVKCIKYVRMWCYSTFGDLNAIHFVCMATPEDINSNAEYIRMADEVVAVPGGSNNYNYANVTIIITIAKQCKCDAVWPGWGHASEYPSLPRQLSEAGIGWIGPNADAMYASGDKIMSTLIAQYAKVPTVPWSGSGIKVKYGHDEQLKSAFKKSCINSLSEAIECADNIGYPVMIKASEGGGGKGIRKCSDRDEMESAYSQVCNEVPGSPIFIMKLAQNARHLEVQLLGDEWGNVIALFGRDCSMQRRHQKIIEEGPVINVEPALLLEMEESAVALAKSVRYVGAGTVEFLYDNDSKRYYFLELNPRLQVEHPVTELISGINLPAAQLMVGMGIPLHCIADIRGFYGEDITETTAFEYSSTRRIKPLCHAIACRITAENPLNNFTPTSGTISELHFRSSPNVWGYFSLKTASSIHDYADSQFGHIFACGTTRDDARKDMVMALSELEIRGGNIRTTIEFLSSILENDEYIAGKFHTTWLESQLKTDIIRVPSHLSPEKIVLLGAVASGYRSLNEIETKLLSDLEHGRNINGKRYRDHLVQCPVELIYKNMKYRILIERTSINSYTLRYRKWKCDVVVRKLSDNGMLVSLDGRTHVLYASWNANKQLILCCDGHTVEFETEYDPSSIKAAIPGKLVKILCRRGQHVLKGESFAEIEVMKMYMPLVVPESGIIDVIAQEGSILQIGQRIATLKLDNMDQIRTAEVFSGHLSEYEAPEKVSVRVDRKFTAAHDRICNMLDGYIAATDIDHEYVSAHLDLMMNALRDPALPLDEFNSALEPLRGRIDDSLYNRLKNKTASYNETLKINRFRWEKTEVFPSESILANISAHKQTLNDSAEDIASFEATISPLRLVCNRHRRGTHFYAVESISTLLETFCLRESRFVDRDENIVIQELRREAPNNLESVATIIRSHFQLKHREAVIMELLNIAERIFQNRMYEFILELTHILETMTSLTDIKYGKIHLKAREILASIDVSSESQRKMEIENMLKSHAPRSAHDQSLTLHQQRRMGKHTPDLFNDEGLLHTIPDLLEILPKYMLSENETVACNAVELWIRSVFAAPFYYVDKKSMCIKWQIDESTQCSFSFSTVNPRANSGGSGSKFHKNKRGFFGFFANLHELKKNFASIVSRFPSAQSLPVHSIILGFKDPHFSETEKSFTISMEKYLTPFLSQLNECGISFISVFVPSTRVAAPHLFTFRYMLDFREDPMTRHIMPPLVTMLEMDRLKMGFHIQWMPTENRRIHIFEAAPMKKRLFTRNWDGKRLFARVPVAQMVKPRTMVEDILSDYCRFGGPEFALMEATHALDSIISSSRTIYRYNHILLACFFDCDADDMLLQSKEEIRAWKKRVFNYIYNRVNHDYALFAKQLKRLHVTHIEIRFQIRISHKTLDFAPYVFRAFLDEPGNGVINIHLYVEKTSQEEGSIKLIDPGYVTGGDKQPKGPLHATDAFAEHIVEHNLMAQRITAKNLNTTYVYDWPILFEKALQNIWGNGQGKTSGDDNLIQFEEYVVDKKANKLCAISRAPGQNDVAMVVWKVTMKTPEFPRGRDIIIASNDIANNLGTFSLDEDEIYNMACNWAQNEGLPFIYLSANSGARIGLSQALINKFRVSWVETETSDSKKEFQPKYLYLDGETYGSLEKEIVNVEKISDDEYKIVDIIGKYGIGVENLSGSGLIAGTTSRASFNTFTLSYVTGRSVGIGAYLVRLGQRIIQKVDSPILLTGYVALNNLLGKSVYLSNQQIGGADEVMMPNGVTHYAVNDDLEGAYQILKWLSYIPSRRGEAYPIRDVLHLDDSIDRDVAYYPSCDKYDVRCCIAGDLVIETETKEEEEERKEKEEEEGDEEETKTGKDINMDDAVWRSGLFDRDSWTEYLSSWASSVVIGRARLGGIPVGIIATETRTTQCVIPPDPALEDESKEISFSQPGQVWYPDSSFKTAQAIRDFSGEELPLFILANWRGFSGGQRDMFHSILKYGSYIVDELADYKQPVFIYLPPTAELRGGAWVVLDSLINERVIEMYSAENAKANVLEPTGTIGLKFRKKKLLQTMHRCDPHLCDLDASLANASKSSSNADDINKEIENRERGLFPIYNKIALMYAQLHDTPQRMKDVGVITAVVEWKDSRRYFYWRLRKKLIILSAMNELINDLAITQNEWKSAKKQFDAFVETNYNNNNGDDKAFVEWFKHEAQIKQFDQFRKGLQQQSIKYKLTQILNQFKGNKKQLKDIFDELCDVDVVNID